MTTIGESTPPQPVAASDSFSALGETSPHSQQIDVKFETPLSAKQRRKRTSPRDHAILESAYQRNSKPDKNERASLVRQVSLGEKEVQIWFQNRRQNDRRKSKPLLPHELIPHFRNGIPTEASQRLEDPESSQESADASAAQRVEESTRLSRQMTPPIDTTPAREVPETQQRSSLFALITPMTDRPERVAEPTSGAPFPSDASSSPCASQTRPSIVRKRSHEEMAAPTQTPPSAAQPSTDSASKSLKRSASAIHLSVAADGSMRVRTDKELTPSPPKKRALPPNSTSRRSPLSRSQSAIEPRATPPFKSTHPKLLGRSRDVRTWEFFCDRDARDALAMRAEEAETGSAVSAINLMRSSSKKKSNGNINTTSPLTPNLSKHNNLRRTQSSAIKSSYNTTSKKPTLSRARSSLPRVPQPKLNTPSIAQSGKIPAHTHHRSSSTDSDKENWLPGTRDATNALRRTGPSTSTATALHEQARSTAQPGSSSLEDMVAQVGQSTDDETGPGSGSATNSDNDNDAEADLPAMMRKQTPRKRQRLVGSERRKEIEKVDEIDCVQGLLSLSQGNWQ